MRKPKFATRIKGGFTPASFKTLGVKNRAVLEALVQAGNASLAHATWNKYGTAERHMRGAEKMTRVKFSYPFTREMTVAYIGYLILSNLSAESINCYLSGIR